MSNAKLASCLMVTLPGPQRLGFLRRSVADYCRQSYEPRELVIVTNGGAETDHAALGAYIDSLGRDDIRIRRVADDLTLGAVRNQSIAAARGEILCQWDDDDRHHPDRLAGQLEALTESGRAAMLLEEVMQFYPQARTLYCTNWHATENTGHPGTIVFRRDAQINYPEQGPAARRGEDSAVVQQLRKRAAVTALGGAAHLFVYVSHGANTWSEDHHRMLSSRLALSQGLLRRREPQLRAGLAAFDFGEGSVTVHGGNGPAFTLESSSGS
jgi:glycosyltransferase involved in cell wall biosynthesis